MLYGLRHAVRSLARAPVFTAAAVLTLALGIGAVTIAFTLVKGILLSPLGYPESGRLVRLYSELGQLRESPNPRLAAIWNRLPVSYLNTADWRASSRTVTAVGLYLETTAVLGGGAGFREIPREVKAARIEPELLRVLGVDPLIGRPFSDAERRDPVVLLGYGLWADSFGGDEAVLGRSVRLDGRPFTVIGVMPAGFGLPGKEDSLWLPLAPDDDDLAIRDNFRYGAVGRLAPGISLAAAREELDRIATDLAAEHPETNASSGVRLVPLLDTLVADRRRILELVAGAALIVLLVACVNVAHLLLARGAERRRELALRLALGAGRLSLLRSLVTEALLLAIAGGVAGCLLALLAQRALPALLGQELPRLDEVTIDGTVLLFAAGAALLAALVAGAFPVLLVSGVSLREATAGDGAPGRSGSPGLGSRRGGLGSRRGRSALVVVEVALTLSLTLGAVLIALTWGRFATVDPGFETAGLLTEEIHLPSWSYGDEARRLQVSERLLAALGRLPGVGSVALVSRLPVAGPAEVWGFRIDGVDPPGGDWTQGRSATMESVTPGIFSLLRIPVIAGRAFDERDGGRADGPRVVMVDRSLAERHWPAGGAVGERLVMGGETYTVVGVFEDILHRGLAQAFEETPQDLMVQPWRQRPTASFAALLSSSGSPEDLADEIRGVVHGIDPELPLGPAVALDQVVDTALAGPRSRALVVGLPTLVVLLMALVGTYGVTAYEVGCRRREIGIRMALGADADRVRRLVLRRLLVLAASGVVVGSVGGLAVAHLSRALLYGVEPVGPIALAALALSALLLGGICLGAGYLPARRATLTDPVRVLRSE